MPRKKPLTLEERLEQVNKDLEKLKKEKDGILKEQSQEREKVRLNRIYQRGEAVENQLPALKEITEEQFKLFLEKVVLTPHSRTALADIVSGKIKPPTPTATALNDGEKLAVPAGEKQTANGGKPAEIVGETPTPNGNTAALKPANTVQGGGDVAKPSPSAEAEGGGSATSAKADEVAGVEA